MSSAMGLRPALDLARLRIHEHRVTIDRDKVPGIAVVPFDNLVTLLDRLAGLGRRFVVLHDEFMASQ